MQENFRQFLDRLRQTGELIDLHQPVDIRHIATLVDQAEQRAVLPQRDRLRHAGRVRDHPLARARHLAMGCKTYGEIEEKLKRRSTSRFRRDR